MTKDDGGPAFPCDSNSNNYGVKSAGMSLRDYLAAMAMQAMITKSNGQDMTGGKKGVPLVAKFSYEYADAMLEERTK